MVVSVAERFIYSPAPRSDLGISNKTVEAPADEHGLLAICSEARHYCQSVLVFCNSRAATALLADKIAVCLSSIAPSTLPASKSVAATEQVALSHEVEALHAAREQLAAEVRQTSGGAAARGLCECLAHGVGFHHAGLTQVRVSPQMNHILLLDGNENVANPLISGRRRSSWWKKVLEMESLTSSAPPRLLQTVRFCRQIVSIMRQR